MTDLSTNEYREKIARLKQQLQTATGQDRRFILEDLYNYYTRLRLMLEAEKIAFEHIALLRTTLPKNELAVHELRLAKLLVDNGKVQQGIEHMNYALSLCSLKDAADKEFYLSILVSVHHTLALRDESFRPQFDKYLRQYETEIHPATTLEKLEYYTTLTATYFMCDRYQDGLAAKHKYEALLKKSTGLSDAYKARYQSYLQQLSTVELGADPDQLKVIEYVKGILEKNKKEKSMLTANVFAWLRKLANAYKKVNDVNGLKETFDELYYAINDYVEENIDNKIYEQKYQSDYYLQEQRLKDAEALNRIKDSVFSYFNHELRTPLNIILSNSELIARNNTISSEAQARLSAIQDQSYNLLNIIDQFIEINKTNLQFNQVNNEVGDVVRFLQTMQTDLLSLAEQKNITLKFRAKAIKKFICQLDFGKLERILYNLITNAIKFTGAGGKVTINAVINKKSKLLSISVADTGIGISPEETTTIFDQFYSAHDAMDNKTTSKGFGIGLYLVKQLVTLLDGKITVQSQPGKGSAFTVTLPYTLYKGAAQKFAINRRLNYKANHVPAAGTGARQKKAPTDTGPGKPQLLIVEDSSELLEVLTASLSPNYNIRTAADGQEAKELLHTFLPDLVITDLMMPRINGIQLTTFIKQHPALDHIPVIMLTAKGSLPNRIKGWQAGIDMFLRKPFSITELEHSIQNIMHTRTNIKRRIELLLTDTPAKKIRTQTPAEKFVGGFKDYVLSNLGVKDIRTSAIAKHLQVDENNLYRKIKALTGYPPVQLITKLKIERAKTLIQQAGFSTIKEVAYACGFNDPKYFSRIYKAETGSLPHIIKK